MLKKQLRGEGVIPVREECCAILKQKVAILEKMKDLGSCSFLCDMGSEFFEKVMCDLEFGISLMPISVEIACGIYWELKPKWISIQLVDNSVVVKSKGIIEDVLVRVDKFIISMDFAVMDMEKNKDIPLIFCR